MKLYYSPGACSLSPHIALREAGLAFDLERVSLSTKKTATDVDFRTINPKGLVPALVMADGALLTEGPAIVQYIADRAPGTHLAPPAGTLDRYRLQEWLNYLSTEIHKAFSPLFNRKTPDDQKAVIRETLGGRFTFISSQLDGHDYLMGNQFTVADGYLFTLLQWTRYTGLDLQQWPTLAAYMVRVAARPAVHAALVAEGLLK